MVRHETRSSDSPRVKASSPERCEVFCDFFSLIQFQQIWQNDLFTEKLKCYFCWYNLFHHLNCNYTFPYFREKIVLVTHINTPNRRHEKPNQLEWWENNTNSCIVDAFILSLEGNEVYIDYVISRDIKAELF